MTQSLLKARQFPVHDRERGELDGLLLDCPA